MKPIIITPQNLQTIKFKIILTFKLCFKLRAGLEIVRESNTRIRSQEEAAWLAGLKTTQGSNRLASSKSAAVFVILALPEKQYGTTKLHDLVLTSFIKFNKALTKFN